MKIALELSDDQAELIQQFLEATAASDANTHGALTMEILALMLLEDVALMVRRPGSWEGANMSTVMASHGYRY